MRALTASLAASGLILAGCAASPEWSSGSAASVEPMRDMHRACMAANVASLDDGAGDPDSLVDTVEALCAPLLEPMRSYIVQEGYGESTADAVVEQVMSDTRREAQDVILRVRTPGAKGSVDRAETPDTP